MSEKTFNLDKRELAIMRQVALKEARAFVEAIYGHIIIKDGMDEVVLEKKVLFWTDAFESILKKPFEMEDIQPPPKQQGKSLF